MNDFSGDKRQYLLCMIYDWCLENSFTPYISITVYPNMDKQLWKYEKNNEIIFNISPNAVHNLIINDCGVNFTARFNGISKSLEIPINAIGGIFAREANQGIQFSLNEGGDFFSLMDEKVKDCESRISRSHLKLVK